MDTWLLIVLIVVAILLLLAVGGAIATSRRAQAQEADILAVVAEVNDALAAAHAQDNGWDPALMRGAAERAFAEHHPGLEPETVTLVHVDDRPGIEHDRAIFRVAAGGAEHDVVLGRDGDGWITVSA